ncbi:MAG: hypothetical protein OIF50_11380 [Flavobacteriaceae bacterium]|nr:hypothetical protein [Flavobacteriaceae bacterium]
MKKLLLYCLLCFACFLQAQQNVPQSQIQIESNKENTTKLASVKNSIIFVANILHKQNRKKKRTQKALEKTRSLPKSEKQDRRLVLLQKKLEQTKVCIRDLQNKLQELEALEMLCIQRKKQKRQNHNLLLAAQ